MDTMFYLWLAYSVIHIVVLWWSCYLFPPDWVYEDDVLVDRPLRTIDCIPIYMFYGFMSYVMLT